MKNYKVPCFWRSWGVKEFKADSLIEAIDKAWTGSIPEESAYVDDSFQVDQIGVMTHNELTPDETDKLDEYISEKARNNEN